MKADWTANCLRTGQVPSQKRQILSILARREFIIDPTEKPFAAAVQSKISLTTTQVQFIYRSHHASSTDPYDKGRAGDMTDLPSLS